MNMQISTETETRYNPVFLSILEEIVGGVTILTTRIPTTTKFLFPGQPLAPVTGTTSAGLYQIVKTAKLKRTIASTAVVTIYVYSSSLPNSPGHNFKVGEWIMVDGGASAATIAAITIGTGTSGVGTDIIYLTAGGGGFNHASDLITGTLLLEAGNDVTTLAAPLYSASCLLNDSIRVRLESGTTLQNLIAGAVVRGTVKESILPCGCPNEAVKTPLTARIRFA